MSATGDGSSHYLTTAGTLSAPSPSYSYAFWYYPLAVPGTGSVTELFSMTSSTTYEVDFIWDHTDTTYYRAAVHASSGPLTILHMPGNPPINQWVHFVVTYDGATISMYKNGYLWASAAAANVPFSGQNANVWLMAFKGPQYYLNGSMANVGVWSSCLTADNVLSLFTGIDPTTVDAAHQLFYDPLNTGVSTPVGPVITNHSTVLNTTYFYGGQGGVEIGGSKTTSHVIYVWSMVSQGGVALGGSHTAAHVIYVWNMTGKGGVALGGNQFTTQAIYHGMSGGIAIGGNKTSGRTTYGFNMSGGVAVGGSFQVSLLTPNNAFVMADGRSVAFAEK